MCLGVPGQVVEIADADKQLGVVEIGNVRRVVNLACVASGPDLTALCGEWVLIHVGFAMARIDALEAERTLALLRTLDDGESQARGEGRGLETSAPADGGGP